MEELNRPLRPTVRFLSDFVYFAKSVIIDILNAYHYISIQIGIFPPCSCFACIYAILSLQEELL